MRFTDKEWRRIEEVAEGRVGSPIPESFDTVALEMAFLAKLNSVRETRETIADVIVRLWKAGRYARVEVPPANRSWLNAQRLLALAWLEREGAGRA